MLTEGRLAVLATVHDNGPHQGLIAITATDNLRYIIFATPKYTRKYKNILKSPAVSLLLDDRRNSSIDFLECTALTVNGNAGPVPEKVLAEYRDLYLSSHPYLEEFVHSPSSVFVQVQVVRYSLVSKFQRVREWSPGE